MLEAGAHLISTINEQVLEDVEDWIILKGFKALKWSVPELHKKIEARLTQQRERAKMLQSEEEKNQEPEEVMGETKKKEVVDIIEEGKIEDKYRKFMEPLRPHERIWNFQWDKEERRPAHVLRPEAQPEKCYIDGRVTKLLAAVATASEQLRSTDSERWQKLVEYTLKIFKDQEQKEDAAYTAWTNSQNQ